MKRLRILSNFRRLDDVIDASSEITHEYLSNDLGTLGFLRKCIGSDLVIINIDQRKLMWACLLRWVLPMFRFRIASVDLILRPPKNLRERIRAICVKIIFSRVDRFVLYFKDLRGYQRFFGIGSDRAAYVPFKVNGWELITARPRGTADGDHVLCAGRTLRDIATFVEAMRRTGLPGVLLQQKRELLLAHGTSAWSGALPPNVDLVIDESDRLDAYLDFIAKARLVVIPRFKSDIAPTGISTYLVAMALNKCVIISDGPGASDVLDAEAVIVPPENAEMLAERITCFWEDAVLRTAVAERGYAYAIRLGGEERLLSDILRAVID
jgi:glycosyltransferase involved in cell wall biosynthesis